MALAIHKPGQGKWTRLISGLGFGIIVLAAAGWLWDEMQVFGGRSFPPDAVLGFWNRLELFVSDNLIFVQAAASLLTLLVGGGLLFWLLNKPNIVEFMIATEAEMRKVNWPSWREIRGSTWIVIAGTFLMAAILFIVDVIFALFFARIGILEGGAGLLSMFGIS